MHALCSWLDCVAHARCSLQGDSVGCQSPRRAQLASHNGSDTQTACCTGHHGIVVLHPDCILAEVCEALPCLQVGLATSTDPPRAQVQLTWFSRRQAELQAILSLSSRAGGGRWRYDVTLAAEAPASQATVLCEAHMDQTVRVPVELFAPGVAFKCCLARSAGQPHCRATRFPGVLLSCCCACWLRVAQMAAAAQPACSGSGAWRHSQHVAALCRRPPSAFCVRHVGQHAAPL